MSALPPSRTPRCSSYHRRGPLVELPLDQFLPLPTIQSTPGKLGPSAKRPVSPGTPVLYSPAKRRILNEEGLFAVKNPFSTPTSGTSPRKFTKTPQQCQQQHQPSLTSFTNVLTGPDSPARRLDFGTSKHASTSGMYSRSSDKLADRKLAPSPEIKSKSRSHSSNLGSDEEYISSLPSQSQPQLPQDQSQNQSIPSSSSLSQHQRVLDFTQIPRELPLVLDTQSIHYPGFAVYRDPHTFIPTIRLTSHAPASTSLEPLQSQAVADLAEPESIDARELVKENLVPRKICKAEKVFLSPPPNTQQPTMAIVSSDEVMLEGQGLTPRRSSIFGYGVAARKAQHLPSQEERKAMRHVLKAEVNGERDD